MPSSSDYVFGANILDNLTTGMYTNSLVIYREYIQNACDSIDEAKRLGILSADEGSVDIYTDDQERIITIRDNGTGIPAEEFSRTLGNIANSDKTLGESKGFRGIGRLCGLAYCERLLFSSKYRGEKTVSYMICNAELMRQRINENQSRREVKFSAASVLNEIISFSTEEHDNIEEHWFEVKLIHVSPENHELLKRDDVINYLSFVAPVPFDKNFTYRKRIDSYIQENGFPQNQYSVHFNGEQIFKDYKTYVKTAKGIDHITEVYFEMIFDERNEVIAWMWYGIRNFQAVIDKDCSFRGLRLRKENIQIGDEHVLQRFFREDRGIHYFIGEVHAISKDLIPNSQRDYFNENRMRNVFEREIMRIFEGLHKLYRVGNELNTCYDKIRNDERNRREFEQKKKNSGFIDSTQEKEEEQKVERGAKIAREARKRIDRITSQFKNDPESPLGKVVSRIILDNDSIRFDQNQSDDVSSGVGIETAKDPEEEDDFIDKTRKEKTTYWTDRLYSLPKNSRKLVKRVIDIVRRNVDEATMSKILGEIEKEFK